MGVDITLTTLGIVFRIDRATQEFSPESPEVARAVRKRPFTIFRFDRASLVLIVVDMAAKPSS